MKSLRVLMISILFALGVATPVVVALTPAAPAEPAITRIAAEPTPTPTSTLNQPNSPGGCPGGGC